MTKPTSRFSHCRHGLRVFAAGLTLGALTACGSGGGGGDTEAVLQGTAATGAPIVGDIRVTGSQGKTTTVRIEANGGYRITVTELKPPYLVEATSDDTAQGSEYAVAFDRSQRVNVTPLSSLALFLAANQTDLQALASGWPSNHGSVDRQDFEDGIDTIASTLAGAMRDAGIDPRGFDLLGSEFDANGRGFDGVLDRIEVSLEPGGFSLSLDGQPLDLVEDTGGDNGNGGNSSGYGSVTLAGSGVTAIDLPSTVAPTASLWTTITGTTRVWEWKEGNRRILISISTATSGTSVTVAQSSLDSGDTHGYWEAVAGPDDTIPGLTIQSDRVILDNIAMTGEHTLTGDIYDQDQPRTDSDLTIHGTLYRRQQP